MFSNEDVTIGSWMLAMNVHHEDNRAICDPKCTPTSIAVWDIPKCSGGHLSLGLAGDSFVFKLLKVRVIVTSPVSINRLLDLPLPKINRKRKTRCWNTFLNLQ